MSKSRESFCSRVAGVLREPRYASPGRGEQRVHVWCTFNVPLVSGTTSSTSVVEVDRLRGCHLLPDGGPVGVRGPGVAFGERIRGLGGVPLVNCALEYRWISSPFSSTSSSRR